MFLALLLAGRSRAAAAARAGSRRCSPRGAAALCGAHTLASGHRAVNSAAASACSPPRRCAAVGTWSHDKLLGSKRPGRRWLQGAATESDRPWARRCGGGLVWTSCGRVRSGRRRACARRRAPAPTNSGAPRCGWSPAHARRPGWISTSHVHLGVSRRHPTRESVALCPLPGVVCVRACVLHLRPHEHPHGQDPGGSALRAHGP